MLSKSEIIRFSKLKQKKYRNSDKLFIAEGKRLIEEALKSKYIPKLISITEQFAQRERTFKDKLKKTQIRLEIVNERDIDKICSTKNPQGIFAVFEIPDKIDHVFVPEGYVTLFPVGG